MKRKMFLWGAALGILLLVSGCYTVIRVPAQRVEVTSAEPVVDDDSVEAPEEQSADVRENDRIYYGYGPYVEFDLFGNSPYWWRHPVSGWGWNGGWWDPWDSYWSPYSYGYAGWSWYPSWYNRSHWGYYHDPFYSYWGSHYWGGHYASTDMKKRPFIRDERHDGSLGGPSLGRASSSASGLAKPNNTGSEGTLGGGGRRVRRTDAGSATSGAVAPERRVRRPEGERSRPQSDKPAVKDSGRRERRNDSSPAQTPSHNPPSTQTPSYNPPPSSSGSSGQSSSSGSSSGQSGSSGSSGGGRRSRN
jgi:hypothetical protein